MMKFQPQIISTNLIPVAGDDEQTDEQSEDKVLTLTQEQLDAMIEGRLKRDRASRKGQDRQEVARLKELQSTLQLKDEESKSMQEYIDELEKKTMTAEEIRAKEEKKAKEKWEAELTSASQRASAIEQKYINSRIDTDLSIAAQQYGVLGNSTPLILSYLRPLTTLQAVVDEDGKQTGEEKVVINFPDIDEEGNQKQVQLSVADTFKRMRELPDQYGNLFDKNKSGGIGGDSGRSQSSKDGYRPGMSMEEYMKQRKENPSAIYGT